VAAEFQVASPLPLELFDYDLPAELIAQEPCEPRDQARLFLLDRSQRRFDHRRVCDLPDILRPGDLVVLNDTRVLPARLYGHRQTTGGRWTGLFQRSRSDGLWLLLSQCRGRLRQGEIVVVSGPHADLPPLQLVYVGPEPGAGHWYRVLADADYMTLLHQYGHVPLPPYIRKGKDRPEDRERYQTVFARRPGSVAAPTAGLHFTPGLLQQLHQRGIGVAYVTLHVGIGTFQPIRVSDVTRHHMHAEWCDLPEPTVERIVRTRQAGGRVVAVGTTTVRVLETAGSSGTLQPWRGETRLYICPPFTFRVVDALFTNFHLPKSSLLVLVSAFAGLDVLKQAYAEAIARRYRFYSYGDAMLIQ